jgi:hypothetical protein
MIGGLRIQTDGVTDMQGNGLIDSRNSHEEPVSRSGKNTQKITAKPVRFMA